MSATPVILQMEAAECGAACLAMVLGHHGRHLTLEEVRTACGTSRDGVNAAELVAAARSFGLTTKVLRREVEDLDALPMPLILHWAFDHFVLLEKIRGNRFVIHDPALGRRVVGRAEFGANFTGLVIASAPNAEFSTRRSGQSVIGLLAREARQSPDAMIAVAVASICSVIPGIAMSGAIGTFVDQVLLNDRKTWVPAILGVLAAVAAVIALNGWLRTRIEAALRTKIGTKIGAQGFWHALHLPLSYFTLRNAGEISGRLRLGAELGGTVAGPLAQLFPNVVMILCYLAIVAFYSPTMALAIGAMAGLNLLVLAILSRRVADANRAYQMADGRASGNAIAGLVAHSTYRLLGREDLLVSRLAAAEDRSLDAEQRLGRLRVLGQIGPAISGLAINAFVITLGALMVMEGLLTLGGIIAVQLIAGLLAAPVAALAATLTQLQEAAGALLRVNDLLENPVETEFTTGREGRMPTQATGRLSLSGVGFGHKVDDLLFSDVALDLEPGRFVALLGASGCGKSTLARICAGLVHPQHGTVMLHGLPLADWDQSRLRRELQYVPQTSAVFTGSIEENITLWDNQISAEDLQKAIAWSGLAPVIARKRGGIMTRITAADAELSGGEAQRLALARALARRPKLVVLDETTSALDPRTEADILASLRASGAGVLMITHRRRTAMMCDEAVLMAPGGIVLRGDPAEVLARFEDRPVRGSIPVPAHTDIERMRA
jgi:ABC-type bacteriocin/lantibiotic exporter with double-glycine peptidase domain